MLQRLCGLDLAFSILLASNTLAYAQVLPSPHSNETPHVEVLFANIGKSVVALNKPWKFHIGDSPLDPATHRPLWAEPNFDDSDWENVDLTSADGAIDPIVGAAGYVTGWTAKGHRRYWGYAWYRIHVRLTAQSGDNLALAGPADVDDGYQVFANGVLLGSFGNFSGNKPVTYYTRPMMFQLPDIIARSNESGDETGVLAFRVWMDPSTLFTSPDAGGFHTAPVLGAAESVAMANRMRSVEQAQAFGPTVAAAFLFFLLAIVSFSLILFDRSDRVYWWLAGIFLLSAIDSGLGAINTWTQFLGAVTDTFLAEVFILPLAFVGWVMVWRVWFRLNRPTWLPRAVAITAVTYMVSNLVGQGYLMAFAGPPISTVFEIVSWLTRLVCIALMLWIVIEGIKREGLDGWLVLPAVILVGIARFTRELRLLHIRTNWYPFGIRIRLSDFANLLLIAVLALLLLRRLLLSIREQRRMALDVKQAKEVQQVILPEARTVFPGLVVETEYRPALEVGGDFFQVVPQADDSLLIVAGDVTGKGLKAGMLVALLVGAIRTAAEISSDPLLILGALNRRLLGRGEAQATCLALRIDSGYCVTVANAGHIAPYLNGKPISMEGALPLGMLEFAEFSMMRFQLKEHDQLVLISDGIAEATDANGNLFGFERVIELVRNSVSPADIAAAAQAFGQNDDISVISVTRIEELAPAVA